jgi:putative metallopeptidase
MAKRKKKSAPVEWDRLELVEKDVRALVAKHHQHLEHATIAVLGKPKAGKRHGRVQITTSRRVTEAVKALIRNDLSDVHYLIEIGGDMWALLDQEKKKVVLDRALCYFAGLDPEKGVWTMRGPDVEEFTEIIERHGLWTADLETFGKEAAKQLELPA